VKRLNASVFEPTNLTLEITEIAKQQRRQDDR
jgi:hypothetical protein